MHRKILTPNFSCTAPPGWLLILTVTIFATTTRAQTASDVLGEWRTEDNRATVEIYKCPTGYCGKIVALKEPDNPDGTPILDRENPDASLRNRKIIGADILTGLEYEGDGEYEDGEIYDPESGKTYSCLMELEDENTLEVRGYIGISLVGRSQTWTRAE